MDLGAERTEQAEVGYGWTLQQTASWRGKVGVRNGRAVDMDEELGAHRVREVVEGRAAAKDTLDLGDVDALRLISCPTVGRADGPLYRPGHHASTPSTVPSMIAFAVAVIRWPALRIVSVSGAQPAMYPADELPTSRA